MELQFFNSKHFEKQIHYRKDCRVTKRNEFLKLVLFNFALTKCWLLACIMNPSVISISDDIFFWPCIAGGSKNHQEHREASTEMHRSRRRPHHRTRRSAHCCGHHRGHADARIRSPGGQSRGQRAAGQHEGFISASGNHRCISSGYQTQQAPSTTEKPPTWPTRPPTGPSGQIRNQEKCHWHDLRQQRCQTRHRGNYGWQHCQRHFQAYRQHTRCER